MSDKKTILATTKAPKAKNKMNWYVWFVIPFVFLFLGVLPGIVMRYGFLEGFPLPFEHLLHTHSHILILSWLNLLGLGVLCRVTHFYSKGLKYFMVAQIVSGILMFFGFLYQSYGPISIFGSTLQMFANYYFTWIFLRSKNKQSNPFITLAFILNIISTLAIFCIDPATAIFGSNSKAFGLIIQFFLHFQIDGWLLALFIGIFLQYLKVKLSGKWLFIYTLSLFLTYALFVNHAYPNKIFYYANVVGVLLQGLFIWELFKKTYSNQLFLLLKLGLFSLLLKGIFQLTLVFPEFAQRVPGNRDLVLFYLHWVLIGIVMFGFLGVLFRKIYSKMRLSVSIFVVGYLLTEFFLGLGALPFSVPYFVAHKYLFLFLSSLVMVAGIGLMCFKFIFGRKWLVF